ncbi:MAG: aminomethyl transferase family protein [Elusimicrobia bacterium]|nr:aminomethyl transferase family protein [Elusimicrobiota bacterium]
MTETFKRSLQAAREGAAYAPAGSPGLVSVRGAGRAGFLHGQLSADVKSLEQGRGVPACLLNVQGKIVSPLGLFALASEHLMTGPRESLPAAAAALARMAPLADCEVEDMTGQRAAWLLIGPRRALVLEALAGRPCDPGVDGARTIPTSAGAALVLADFLAGPEAHLVFAPRGGEDRFAGILAGAAETAGALELPPAALEVLRVEAGAAAWGREAGPDCFPQEIGLERAVQSNKGCYLGQEVMARLRDRGHVNRVLVSLLLDAPAAPGDALEDEDGLTLGRLTSVAPSAAGTLALGFIKPERAAAGQRLAVRAGAARVPAVVR